MIGAGLVSSPLVDYLHRDESIRITVASQLKEDADILANKYPGVEPMSLNVLEDAETLREIVNEADVVVSLVPYALHHIIAKTCIDAKTHLVTTSYLNPEVKSLDEE